ncbi:MAG: ABC-F family ATP-binding cassette domain-containing protein [Pseudolabrys sp.]|nr:ABC-F family ATP-binding cassette domain-containing protein [Pseudolabrys sp.]MDP2293973.1 ABC-F family ATP-binding cassette domain-containing protein [Pseudolabrys sp.]
MLIIDDLTVRIAGRSLLEDASARIVPGARVGLVGRNGTGKSTLFNVITGELAAESGSIEMPPRWRIGRLAQEAPNGPESLLEVVLKAPSERTELMHEAETATDPHRIAEIQTRLADIGAHAAPARAASILSGLGFSTADQARPCAEFSGGWRMRVALAATLFSEPDLLMLDEPTNYLDLEGTLWLQDHLAKYPHTMIIVSHDRDLLDNAVNQILALEAKKLTLYKGGYSDFERLRSEKLVLDQKMMKKQDAQRAHLQAFVDRFRAKASKASQAQSRIKMLAKMQPISSMVTDDVRPIVIPAPEKLLSPPIIATDDVDVGYDGRVILSDLSLRIDNDDRIALLGSNGNGKSTLVKLLAGKLKPMSGTVTRAATLKVGYFAQHQVDELDLQGTPYDHVRRLMPDQPEAKVRGRVGTIGFSQQAANTKVEKLSGGEKARLLLGLATFDAPQLIILDEPTNHLDIDSRGALIEAINDYPGAVILVSHDRYLLEACVDRLWLVSGGRVKPFDGDLNDYMRLVLSSDNRHTTVGAKSTTRPDPVQARRAAAEKRVDTAPLRKKITQAEAEIAQLNKQLGKLDATLADGTVFAKDPARAAELSKTRANVVAAIAKAEEAWLAASSALETA